MSQSGLDALAQLIQHAFKSGKLCLQLMGYTHSWRYFEKEWLDDFDYVGFDKQKDYSKIEEEFYAKYQGHYYEQSWKDYWKTKETN